MMSQHIVAEPAHLRRRLSPLQVQQLSDGDLHARITTFKQNLGTIGFQLRSYKSGQEVRTPEWRRTALKAKEAYATELALAKAEAQQRQKPTNPGTARDRGHAFVAAAKMVLDKETIRQIWDLAEQRDPALFPKDGVQIAAEKGSNSDVPRHAVGEIAA